MAKITIGEKDYVIKPLVFDTMERVWPIIQQIQAKVKAAEAGTPDATPIPIMALGVAAVAIAVAQDDPELRAIYDDPANSGLTEDEKDQLIINKIKRQITTIQTQNLEPIINEFMAEAGFKAVEPGESEAILSTATGTASSPSLSPQAVKEEAGPE